MQTKPAVTDHTVIQARQKQRVTDDAEGLPVTFSRKGTSHRLLCFYYFSTAIAKGGPTWLPTQILLISLAEHDAHGNFCDLQLKTWRCQPITSGVLNPGKEAQCSAFSKKNILFVSEGCVLRVTGDDKVLNRDFENRFLILWEKSLFCEFSRGFMGKMWNVTRWNIIFWEKVFFNIARIKS